MSATAVNLPSDPLFAQQWHLLNTGQTGGVPGIDLQVVNVWQDYTGVGVTVGLLDDGAQYIHPDLDDNYDLSRDTDVDESDDDPAPGTLDFHGTSVAGIIAAEANNGIGGVGVAPEATIAVIRMGFPPYFGPYEQDGDALQQMSGFDVVNNSWGYIVPFADNFSDELFQVQKTALQNAVQSGRNGLGTVVVFAAGNDRPQGSNSNYHNLNNSRFTIAVAALNHNGVHTYYSDRGANLLVSALGGGAPTLPDDFSVPFGDGIVTTDRLGSPGYNLVAAPLEASDYTDDFGGTSAAAPMVTGIVALMLEANPKLGYRDVQEILAYSARQTDQAYTGWATNAAKNWNGGGLHISHDYGFGLVNAHAVVRLAETWTTQSTFANETKVQVKQAANLAIPDGKGELINTVQVNSDLTIEHVEVELELSHPWIGDLEVLLTAPNGTESSLVERPGVTATDRLGSNQANLRFTFSSTRHWGELAVGTWTLIVRDRITGEAGTLDRWALNLYGDAATPNNTYIYTDEFANYTQQPARRTLADDAGVDTLNAAAVTFNTVLNLAPGASSTLANQSLIIAANTVIENAIAGDGADTLTGNAANNQLKGERGADNLNGLLGNDLLDGGQGNDRLAGGAGADTLVGNAGADTLTGGINSDRFLYATGKAFAATDLGIDIVTDFQAGVDKIALSKATFTALRSGVGDSFSVKTEFGTVANDSIAAQSAALIVYSQASGTLFYNANGRESNYGAGAAFAQLQGTPALAASDFVLV
ncbi:MAG: hypothetical protein Kow00121_63120 [Elainellaceae cyanobacterium]